MFRPALCAIVLISAMSLSSATGAQAQNRTKVGTLICRMGPSVGALVGSRQRMTCRFRLDSGRRTERYSGTITRFGFDVGITVGGVMSWTVLKRTRGVRSGSLAGTYIGASGDISFGVGLGANVLIGGSRRSMVLQPVSVVGQVGVNLAFGVAGLTLRHLR